MEIFQITPEIILLLFVTSVVAGYLDTLAGGGGLITMPILILCGVSPLSALATNKLQGSAGTATATFMLFKKKRIKWSQVRFLMLSAFIGSVTGTIALQLIDIEMLEIVIPIVLIFICIYFLFSSLIVQRLNAGILVSDGVYRGLITPIIGWYDGMFGPGTGSFFALAGVSLRGQSLHESTAFAKVLNFSTNIAALFVFFFSGYIIWTIGIFMMLGQVIGASLGVHFLFKINPMILRYIITIMCFGMLLSYCVKVGWLF